MIVENILIRDRALKKIKRANTLTWTHPQADTFTLEGEIDQLMYELDGLTQEEIDIVEGVK